MKWHKGPPPSVGWWPASVMRDSDSLRWWDGNRWSGAAFSDYTIENVAAAALAPAREAPIEWTDRPASWPARSRT